MAEIHHLPTSREVARQASLRPADLHVVEQAPAGRYVWPDPQYLPVEQDGCRVLIRGELYRCFLTLSNATRVAAALTVLAELGCPLPEPPKSAVRRMLAASTDLIGGESGLSRDHAPDTCALRPQAPQSPGAALPEVAP